MNGDIVWMPLKLGADGVQRLLPHRRPFLFVDAIDAIAIGARPSLRARKLVSSNEPVFDGHFPGHALWPGVYTIEGLGQATNLLNLLIAMAEGFAERGGTWTDLVDALRRGRGGCDGGAGGKNEQDSDRGCTLHDFPSNDIAPWPFNWSSTR